MTVEELIARAEITDVLTRYVRGVDRADWDLVRSCYHHDATDDHGLFAGGLDGLIEFMIELSSSLTSTSHQLGPPHIEVDGDFARAETYCRGWYERPGRDGAPRSIAQCLRYLDRFERRNDRWAIADRVVVLDHEHVFNADGPTTPAASWKRGAHGNADPSWHLFIDRPN